MTTAMLVALVLAAPGRDCEWAQRPWAEAGLEAPCEVFGEAVSVDRQKLATEHWSLTDEQATCFLNALDHPAGRHVELNPWSACLERWPDVLAFWPLATGPEATLDRVAARAKLETLERVKSPWVHAPWLALVTRDHHRLSALLESAKDEDVASELALAAVTGWSGELTKEEWKRLASPLLLGPLRNGELRWAAALFLALPPAQRDLELDPSSRVQLALGLACVHQRDLAAVQLERSGSPSTSELDARHEGLYRDAARWWLTGQRTLSAWDAALDLPSLGAGGAACLAPYVAPHTQLLLTDQRDARQYEERASGRGGTAFSAALRAARAEARAQLPAAPPSPAAGVPTLPGAVTSPWSPRTDLAALPRNPKAKVTLPAGFWVVRAERQHQRVVALALSQLVDPVGEVSPGGYWLLLSTDAGAHWERLYLSLGDHRPFHAWRDSKVPLLDAHDVVRLDLQEADIDESAITFPPLSTALQRGRDHVVLEARLASLRADTDADGLTDLLEARLLLDPNEADTDHDGVNDLDDLTPRLDDRLPLTPEAEFLNAFFEHFMTGGKAPRPHVVPPGSGPLGAPRAATLEDVRFLVGQHPGLRPLVRLITLTPAELEAARGRYGAFYPMHLELMLNGTEHAFIRWSESWRGGTLRLDRAEDGSLTVTELESWIT